MDPVLLDTDLLSEVLKQRSANVVRMAAAYLHEHRQFAFSAFSRFEVLRGCKEKASAALLARFASFCSHSLILPVSEAIFDTASDLWTSARRGGHPHSDADLIIAATAVDTGRVLVTGNSNHFSWIPELPFRIGGGK